VPLHSCLGDRVRLSLLGTCCCLLHLWLATEAQRGPPAEDHQGLAIVLAAAQISLKLKSL
uniref:Uncharacterized protein n=1 Tax=Piliocolobus tephrosceles TaxID=591936 RepID=A0A8C9HEV7_9PRIM